jgi:hypothetical protein
MCSTWHMHVDISPVCKTCKDGMLGLLQHTGQQAMLYSTKPDCTHHAQHAQHMGTHQPSRTRYSRLLPDGNLARKRPG